MEREKTSLRTIFLVCIMKCYILLFTQKKVNIKKRKQQEQSVQNETPLMSLCQTMETIFASTRTSKEFK